MLVLDGLGGLQHPDTGKTELETAATPNMDALAAKSLCGLTVPVYHGITPGSAPGHTSLFGYDPVDVSVGRGVLEAVGIDFPIQEGDVLIRGNFCTVDENGNVIDRRAGRVKTEISARLCKMLEMQIEDVQVIVTPVKDHRCVIAFRGPGMDPDVNESDPLCVNEPPVCMVPEVTGAEKTARIATEFTERAKEILKNEKPANMILLRGFSNMPKLPTMEELYGLKPAAIATYPMYRGLARLVGMDILKTGMSLQDEADTLREAWNDYDFFFVHVKMLDAAGEDGDFERKVKSIEEIDAFIPEITKLNPDVMIITGDHSTPAVLSGHSWHPVPTLLYSKVCRADRVTLFDEISCIGGGLGMIPATSLMPLAMANSMKLLKYGA